MAASEGQHVRELDVVQIEHREVGVAADCGNGEPPWLGSTTLGGLVQSLTVLLWRYAGLSVDGTPEEG